MAIPPEKTYTQAEVDALVAKAVAAANASTQPQPPQDTLSQKTYTQDEFVAIMASAVKASTRASDDQVRSFRDQLNASHKHIVALEARIKERNDFVLMLQSLNLTALITTYIGPLNDIRALARNPSSAEVSKTITDALESQRRQLLIDRIKAQNLAELKKRAEKRAEEDKEKLAQALLPPARRPYIPLTLNPDTVAQDVYATYRIRTSVRIAGRWHTATIDQTRDSLIDSRLVVRPVPQRPPPVCTALFPASEWDDPCAEVRLTFTTAAGQASCVAQAEVEVSPTLALVQGEAEAYTLVLGKDVFLGEQVAFCRCVEHCVLAGCEVGVGTLRLWNGVVVRVEVEGAVGVRGGKKDGFLHVGVLLGRTPFFLERIGS